jgi:hypothetical protein
MTQLVFKFIVVFVDVVGGIDRTLWMALEPVKSLSEGLRNKRYRAGATFLDSLVCRLVFADEKDFGGTAVDVPSPPV